MGVFSMEPKSFKMERETPFANHLKTLIHNHLLHFSPHSDDVLAEYITVLVCNGKNQNQTVVDVEAFLRKRSREFVSWLWRLLLKSENQLLAATSSEKKLKILPDPSYACKENDERNSDPPDFMGERGDNYYLSTKRCKSDHVPTLEDHPLPSSSIIQSRAHQSRSEVPSALVEPETKLANSADKVNANSRALSSHGDKSGGNLVTLLTVRPRIHHTTNTSRRSLPPPLDSSSDNKKTQRSVWDRLGRPPKHIPYVGHETLFYAMNKFENTSEQINHRKSSEQTGRISPLSHLATDRGREMSREAGENWSDRNTDSKKVFVQVQSVNNIRRKRHFSEVNSQTVTGHNQPEEVRQARERPEMQMDGSHAVVTHVQEVKQRLRRVEIEMTKLRSMQSRIKKDGKSASSTDSGVMKTTDEDGESKTVLVTNVHQKATKEALTAYFQRCGSVVNVVILDDVPLQRAAYITFESKESTDMALGLSGRVFYSRTMMVSRKGDTTPPSLPRFIGKKTHNLVLHSMSRVTRDKHRFSGSHLQWRRESLASKSEPPASTDEPRKEAAESSSRQVRHLCHNFCSMSYYIQVLHD